MPRVLVVDDEPRIVSFISRALAGEGLGVDSAYDGIRGLQLARSRPYELVVLDLLLPGLDGVSVLRGILEHRPEQRVLILSVLSGGSEDPHDWTACPRSGSPGGRCRGGAHEPVRT